MFIDKASRKKSGRPSARRATRFHRIEKLESRLVLSASAVGDEFLVNDLVIGEQSIANSSAAIVTTAVNQVVVFESKGPVDRQGVFARILELDGQLTSPSFRVNSIVRGDQHSPAVAADSQGNFVVTWAGHGVGDKHGIFFQQYDSDGSPIGDQTLVNTTVGGNQAAPSVVMANDGSFMIAWNGVGAGDVSGVFLRPFDASGTALASELLVNSTTDDQQTAPSAAFNASGEVLVAWQSRHQDGNDWGIYGQKFSSTATRLGGEIQLNSTTASSQMAPKLAIDPTGGMLVAWQSRDQDGDGWGVVARHLNDQGVPNLDEVVLNAETEGNQQDVSIAVSDDGRWLASWSTGVPDGSGWEVEVKSFETDGSPSTSVLVNNQTGGPNSGHQRFANVAITGDHAQVIWMGAGATDHRGIYSQRYELDLGNAPQQAPDLVAFAQALADSGTQFFGAVWCPACTAQKETFKDGGQFLPFIEVTNPDRTPNQIAIDNNITTFPTWVFPDGSRLEGAQTLQTISNRSGVAIPTSHKPFFSSLPDVTLLVGSPLHVSLDGYDANGGSLTYSVTSDHANVSATILSGNRSARVEVAGYGDMVFELFEQRASRATERMIELAESDFYQDIIFHRVINNFVIQGGDPTGTGSGGSTLGDFDDQFHLDLQHNRTGLLSMAKTTDDTNDSQFFITEGTARHLDFNHTIFGLLVEGESNRAAISDTAVTNSQPINPVTMEGIGIFEDEENAVLMLQAADGATGSANITVTVTDQDGHTFNRTFRVDLAADTVNGTPYLEDIGPVSVASNTSAEVQLTAVDVESDPVFYTAQQSGSVNYTFTISETTGLLRVTPPTNFVGELEIRVGVGSSANSADDLQQLKIEFT